MAWKNLAEDLAEELGSYVFEVGYDESEKERGRVAAIYSCGSDAGIDLGVGVRELDRRRLLTKTKHAHAERTGRCIVCGVRPIKPRRGGKSIHCSRACQVRGDQKYRTRVAA